MCRLLFLLAALASASPALAHDFWLQPHAFWIEPGGASATLQVGHGQYRQRSPISADRITLLRSFGPNGVIDQKPGLRMGGTDEDVRFEFPQAGSYIVALETNSAISNLPAIRFNDYLQAEGLTLAIRYREQTAASDNPGRELYSRRAKALVQVGPAESGGQAQLTEPVGLSLEIVPEQNPYRLKLPGQLPIRVLSDGQPLAGALVKLTDLDADERPIETHLTDAEGRAAFTIPRPGSWLLNVIWAKPILANRTADYITTFSSLSFGYPPG